MAFFCIGATLSGLIVDSWILVSSHSISLSSPCHVASGRLHWRVRVKKPKFPELL